MESYSTCSGLPLRPTEVLQRHLDLGLSRSTAIAAEGGISFGV